MVRLACVASIPGDAFASHAQGATRSCNHAHRDPQAAAAWSLGIVMKFSGVPSSYLT